MTGCPTADRLQDLLAERVPPAERGRWTSTWPPAAPARTAWPP